MPATTQPGGRGAALKERPIRTTTEQRAEQLRARFRDRYGEEPRVYHAPGRVNLIGEHTDYTGGFVMPVALDLFTRVAIRARPERRITASSDALAGLCRFDLDAAAGQQSPASQTGANPGWGKYIQGVAVMIERAGHRLRGADMMISSDVPLGSGLSSSAALEVATAFALLATVAESAASSSIDPAELAKICLQAENEFVGVQCGIMDQMAAARCSEHHALLLDCRNLSSRHLPIPHGARIVVANTMVQHEHGEGEYNVRCRECEKSAKLLSKALGETVTLRDLTPADLTEAGRFLPQTLLRRVRHVVSENGRVQRAAKALEAGDVATLGTLMNQSHDSLRDDYQVSCQELDQMVDLARQADGVFGSRMTGGGFGGCTVSLVAADRVEDFVNLVSKSYFDSTGIKPWMHVCSASSGVCRIYPPRDESPRG